jgi:hypothetical protein
MHVSDLAHVFGDRDVDGDERDVRAGHETPFRFCCCRVDRHDGDQVDLLRDEILDLRGLRSEVSVWIAEVKDDFVASSFLHALLDILVKLEAAAVGGGANLVGVRGGEGSRADKSKHAQGDRGGEPHR